MKLALVMYKGEKRLAISSQDRLLSPASGEATGIPLDVVSVCSAATGMRSGLPNCNRRVSWRNCRLTG